jgi:hypothetical protein
MSDRAITFREIFLRGLARLTPGDRFPWTQERDRSAVPTVEGVRRCSPEQKDQELVKLDVAGDLLTLAVAVRVFAPDAAPLFRRLLGAGVRIGAAHLAERQRPGPGAVPDPGKDGGW